MTKKVFFILISLFTTIQSTYSQDINYDLGIADSLFQEKKFTESFEIYNAILETEEKASPQMLLKMSYIKEGLQDYSNALYYLNLYYLKTSNEKVLSKMEKLGNKNGLEGYESGNTTFFSNLYHKYYTPIVFTSLTLALILASFLVFQKIKQKGQPVLTGILLVLLLGGNFFIINFTSPNEKGIIIENSAYIMNAPSSSAEVIEIVKKGHLVKINGVHDVWAQITWDGQTGYIKEKKIKKIAF